MTLTTERAVWVTTGQAAELLGVSRSTMVRMLDAGRLPSDQPNKHRRVRLDDLLAYKESRHRGVMDALAASRGETERIGLGGETPEAWEDALRHVRQAATGPVG